MSTNNKGIALIKNLLKEKLWIFPVVLGGILRLYKMTFSSIWHDEGYTMWLLRYDFGGIIERTARDVHPPAYYLIAKPWVTVFGSSVFSTRFLSLIFSVGIIYFLYRTIELAFNKKIAFWASMFVAFSPFMVRFGQEARMYGVVAFFTTLATYYFFKAIKERHKENLYLILFTLSMSVAMYTQYYAFFVIISLWVIYAILTPKLWQFRWITAIKERRGVFNWKWWLANVTLLLLYLPWFPVAYSQVTRVSGSYWIKPEWITAKTIPNNILQFITYSHIEYLGDGDFWKQIVFWTVVGLLILIGLVAINKGNYKKIAALYVFGYLPMILVFTLSKLRTPVYQDRYFPFSAIALFAIWGLVIASIKKPLLRSSVGLLVLIVMLYGNYIMHKDVSHNMKKVKNVIEQNSQAGDEVYSGELYTFLDGAYYLGYDNIKLLSAPVDGYGETSLFYDQQDKYLAQQGEISASRVWVIGKTGDKEYFDSDKWLEWSSETYFEENKNNGLKVVLYTQK